MAEPFSFDDASQFVAPSPSRLGREEIARAVEALILQDCHNSYVPHDPLASGVGKKIRNGALDAILALSLPASEPGECERLSALWIAETRENERLRAALKPFAEADWYARGNDRFDGIVSGSALTEAKLLTNG